MRAHRLNAEPPPDAEHAAYLREHPPAPCKPHFMPGYRDNVAEEAAKLHVGAFFVWIDPPSMDACRARARLWRAKTGFNIRVYVADRHAGVYADKVIVRRYT